MQTLPKKILFSFPIVFTSRLLFKSGRKGKSGFSFCQAFLRKKIIYSLLFLQRVLLTTENQCLALVATGNYFFTST